MNVEDIAVYGAGGFGSEVLALVKSLNLSGSRFNIIGFFDDGRSKGETSNGLPVLGGAEELGNWETKLNVVFAISDPKVIKRIVKNLSNKNLNYPNIIAGDVNFFDSASFDIGFGNVIFFASRISVNVKMGNFNICNSMLSVGHDVQIGDFNYFGPVTRISGNVNVDELCNFSVGTIILQGLSIGPSVVTAPGAIVTRIAKSGLYYGNPARLLKNS